VTQHDLSIVVVYESRSNDLKEQIVLGDVDRAQVELALRDLSSLPIDGTVELVLTTNFDFSVRQRSGDEDGRYRHQRPDGRAVAARAMCDADGQQNAIVIHAALFSGQRPHVEWMESIGVNMRRIIRHEGWHTVLQQRREDPIALVAARGSTREDMYLLFAAQVVDEFRVERAMCEDGWWRVDVEPDAASLKTAFRRLVDASRLPPDDTAEPFLETKLGHCQGHGQTLACLAAELIVLNQDISQRFRRSKIWKAVADPFWDRLVESLAPVASARQGMSMGKLLDSIDAVAALLSDWTRHLGLEP
jgi:hypothetical protein